MEILTDKDQWLEKYNAKFVDYYNKTQEIDWKQYQLPNNKEAISGNAIDLSKSRLLFISSAGGYLTNEQQPYDAENDLGDYSIRRFPSNISFDKISYAHTHYDHTAINKDPQVLMPLEHLQKMVEEQVIGELAQSMVSFMGYQPNLASVVDETIPAILQIAKDEQVQAALLVPS